MFLSWPQSSRVTLSLGVGFLGKLRWFFRSSGGWWFCHTAEGHASVMGTSGMTLRKQSLLKVRAPWSQKHQTPIWGLQCWATLLGALLPSGRERHLFTNFVWTGKGLGTLRKWLMPLKPQKIEKGMQPTSLSTPILYYCNNRHNQTNSYSWLPTGIQSDCHLTTSIKQICEGAFCVMYMLWS